MEAGSAWEPVNVVSNAGGEENTQLEIRGRPGHVALKCYIMTYPIAKRKFLTAVLMLLRLGDEQEQTEPSGATGSDDLKISDLKLLGLKIVDA